VPQEHLNLKHLDPPASSSVAAVISHPIDPDMHSFFISGPVEPLSWGWTERAAQAEATSKMLPIVPMHAHRRDGGNLNRLLVVITFLGCMQSGLDVMDKKVGPGLEERVGLSI
jgi:hypothetical protein